MARDIGYFIDKGDKIPGSSKIISKTDHRTDLEYFIVIGKLPRKQGNCDLCKNKNKQEICDKCTGMNPLFICITIKEAKERREKEIKDKELKNGK